MGWGASAHSGSPKERDRVNASLGSGKTRPSPNRSRLTGSGLQALWDARWRRQSVGNSLQGPRVGERPGCRHSFIYNIQVFRSLVLRPGTTLPPGEHLAMSGDTFWLSPLWRTGRITTSFYEVEARDAADHPTMRRTGPHRPNTKLSAPRHGERKGWETLI